MGHADALTGTLTPDGNGLRRTFDGVQEEQITWLAAQLVVANVSALVATLRDGPFKDGMESACEEILFRLDMESRHEFSCTRNDDQKFSAALEVRAAAPSNLGRAPEDAADGDPLGVSGPKESVR